MKVLLVVYDNDSYIHWFPQGLAYLAAVLRNEGHEIVIYNQDIHHYPDAHLTAYLDEHEFDVVGVGVIGGYYQYRKLKTLSAAIQASKNRPFYVIGGHGPSPEPEYFLRISGADAVVMGEGEVSTVNLLKAVAGKQPMRGVKGIAFRDGDKVVVNERQPLIKDVDTLPFPAYDLFPMEVYRLLRLPNAGAADMVIPMLSGRGCPYQCTFCYRMDEGFRPRSAAAIIDEVKFLKKKYGMTYIGFSDELLMSSEQRTTLLCEAFLQAGINMKWDCNGRLNFAQPKVLSLMKRAGCVFINYGIESMDDEVLKNYKKRLTSDQIVQGIEATLAAGISPGLNLIFGNIGDNRTTLNKNVEFLLKYDDGAQMRTIRPVTPYPGSELYHHAIEKGLMKDCEDFYERKHTNSDLLAINFTDMTDEDFHKALLEANTRLLVNYFDKRKESYIEQSRKLYLGKDAGFRGYRQS
jgi:radical SAM superfamily enzyme YgiQ (UPF0313 family)